MTAQHAFYSTEEGARRVGAVVYWVDATTKKYCLIHGDLTYYWETLAPPKEVYAWHAQRHDPLHGVWAHNAEHAKEQFALYAALVDPEGPQFVTTTNTASGRFQSAYPNMGNYIRSIRNASGRR